VREQILLAMLGFLALMLVSGGGLAGWLLASLYLDAKAKQLDDQAASIQAEWEALTTAQRLHTGFLAARQAMRADALRYSDRDGDGHG
jgi:hypothetical protein